MGDVRRNIVPIERLHEVFSYEPSTGDLRWKVAHRQVRLGMVAGCLMPDGYRRVKVNHIPILVHRIAWAMTHGVWPINEIDHIDGDKSNNRLANLRDVPGYVNIQNIRTPRRDNSSGFTGVSFCVRDRRWIAEIQVHKQKHKLGRFSTAAEAGAAYLAAKRELHEGCTL